MTDKRIKIIEGILIGMVLTWISIPISFLLLPALSFLILELFGGFFLVMFSTFIIFPIALITVFHSFSFGKKFSIFSLLLGIIFADVAVITYGLIS